MDFFEKQARTVGFLLSCFVLGCLIWIIYSNYSQFKFIELSIFIFLSLLISGCLVAQIKLYKVSGYKYELVTLPSLILAIVLFFV